MKFLSFILLLGVAVSSMASTTRSTGADTIFNEASLTKLLTFNLSGQTASTTLTLATSQSTSQTLSIPNITGADTLPTLAFTQTFSGTNTFSTPIKLSSLSTAGVILNNASGTLSSSAGPLAVANGGSGSATALTQYGVRYASSTTAEATTAAGTAGYPLVANSSAAPTFQQLSLTAGVTGTLPSANGGLGVASPTAHYVLVGEGSSAVTPISPSTAGYVMTSNGTGADPSFQVNAGLYTFANSVVNTSGTVALSGDSASPGNTMYYGTNGSGTKGFYSLSAAANNYWTLSTNDITNNNSGKVNMTGANTFNGNVNIGDLIYNFTSPGLSVGYNNYEVDIGMNYSTNAGWVQALNGAGTQGVLQLNPNSTTSAGGVGIGMTTAPGALLEVNGTSKFDGAVTVGATLTMSGSNVITGNKVNLNGAATFNGYLNVDATSANFTNPSVTVGHSNYELDMGYNYSGYGYLQSFAGGTSTYGPLLLQPSGSNVGIGVTGAPAAKLEVNGSAQIDGNALISTGNVLTVDKINMIGSVGTNYTNVSPLQIGLGSAIYDPQISIGQGASYYRMDFGYANTGSIAWWQAYNGGSTTYSAISLNPKGGNVVIGGGTGQGDATLTVKGNVGLEGTAPTVSSCGGGAIASGSSNNKGQVTGITSATSCTITFSSALPTAPACVFSTNGSIIPYVSSISTSAVTSGMTLLTGTLYYICF